MQQMNMVHMPSCCPQQLECADFKHFTWSLSAEISSSLIFHRYTCPFVEKFSIDIETYYKSDTGNQPDVFNLSAADKRQRTIGEMPLY